MIIGTGWIWRRSAGSPRRANAVVWFVAGILLIKDIDLDKVLKVDLVTRICLGCALIILPLVGLYTDHADQMTGGRLRSSFGWSHPNEMGLFFLMFCILWILHAI